MTLRRLGIAGMLAVLACAFALTLGAVAQGSDSYTFDVIFDDARGLVSGQVVKIAGATAGTISSVTVTHDFKAEIQATISDAFRFHTDASCIIRPDGLIAENYLDCDPGNAGTPFLPSIDGRPPTVPVSQTTEPVSLLDLFNIFNVPTRERFQVLVDELGIGTAGEGDNINSILLRANPTLQLAQHVIGILDGQTHELSTAIAATDSIAADAASDPAAVKNFLHNASALTAITADHSSALSQAIAELPGLLHTTQPSLSDIDAVARYGTPLLAEVDKATPYLDKVDTDIGPFAKLAKPALAAFAGAVTAAIPAVKQATPVVDELRTYLLASRGSTQEFAHLAVNLIQHGFAENFFSVVYYVATALSRYDSTSHMLSALLVLPDEGGCALYATKQSTDPDCVAHFGKQPAFVPSKRHHHRHGGTKTNGAKSLSQLQKQLVSSLNKVLSALGGVTSGLGKATHTLGGAIHGVLGNVLGAVGKNSKNGQTGNSSAGSESSLQDLLNFLLR